MIKDYVQRPKYAALRKTELFLAYDRRPFDVGDWYRTVRFNPTVSNDDGRRTPISPASSTVTLSPDGNRSCLDPTEADTRRVAGQRDASLTRYSPALSIFESQTQSLWKDYVPPNLPKSIAQSHSTRSQTLPPPGALPLRHGSPTPTPPPPAHQFTNHLDRPGSRGFNGGILWCLLNGELML